MNAAKLLRQKILDLAIHGKLTKREKGDEPAAELLARIAAEKQKLIAAKKIKKEKSLPSIADDEHPFDIPDGWKWCRLGDVYNFIDYRGKTPHKIKGGVPLITARNVRRGYLDYKIRDFISADEFAERKSRGVAKIGDVLFTTEAPLGNVALADLNEFSTGQRLIAFQQFSNSLFSNELVCYFLQSFAWQKLLLDRKTGTTVAGIKSEYLKQILLPFPPLAEQKRIVVRVDELLAEVDKYSAAMDALALSSEMMEKKVLDLAIRGKLTKREKGDESAAALIARIAAEKQKLIAEKKLHKVDVYDPITDDEIPFDELPSGWSWCRFGEVIDYVQPTEYIVRDTNYDDSYSTPVLTAGQSFILGYTNEKDHHFKTSKECPVIIFDDFTTSTQWVDFEFKVKSSAMKILVPYEGCEVCMRYLFMAMRNNPFRPSTHARHWIDKFSKFVLPLPPLAEQKRIVARVDELLAECRKMRGK